MGAIINNTLELAKQGQTVVSSEPVDFRRLVTDCWHMTTTDEDGLTIHGEATICGDPDRLRRLFENLFRNCIDHAGADVAVTTGLVGDDGLYVEDDGPGIPVACRDVLFDPGYSTSDSGAGFGLAIVSEIVDAHGWTIHVTDTDHGGARFELTGIELRTESAEDDTTGISPQINYHEA